MYLDDADYLRYEAEAAMEEFLDDQLRRIEEERVFHYLATYGDAIEVRVRRCLDQAKALIDSGYAGAGLVRATTGIEVTIRFFLARPLVQGAFLSDDWAKLISQKILNGRTSEDRKLLPAILRNWNVDITSITLPDGSKMWEHIVSENKKGIWQRRNDYVHKADDIIRDEAVIAVNCLDVLLSKVVDPLAQKIGFTREQTGYWSVVAVQNPPEFPNLNPSKRFTPEDPFV